MRPRAPTSRSAFLNAALFVIALAPALLMLHAVVTTWLPLPYWDEWTTPGEMFVSWCNGTFTLRELFSQHNESRKAFPRLLYLGLAQLGGWDVRREMALIFFSVCGITALFYRAVRNMPGANTRTALLATIAASFLCFSWVQLENFLWGVQVEVFFPGLAVLAVVAVNLSGLSLPRKCALNVLLAVVATYTVAHGMLLWILGVPLLAAGESLRSKKTLLTYLAYAVSAGAAIVPYFIGYQRPLLHPPMLAGDPTVLTVAHYLVLWVGSYFNSTLFSPFIVGLAAIILFTGGLIVCALVIRRTGEWRTFYPALMLGVYACLTGGITALGRIGFGVQQALDIRYRTYNLFFYLALAALVFALYCAFFRPAAPTRRRIFIGGCTILGLVGTVGWIACYRDGIERQRVVFNRNATLLRALEWIDVIPDNPDLLFIFPSIEVLRKEASILREHGFLRLPFVTPALAAKVRVAPPLESADSFGRLEAVSFDTNRRLVISGRARTADSNRLPDCIIIGSVDTAGSFKPFTLVEIANRRARSRGGDPRPEVEFRRRTNPANLPEGNLTVLAWAIDLAKEEAHPLAGALNLTVPVR